MICIKRNDLNNGQFCWIAEDADGVIGRIAVNAGDIPEVTQLEFQQKEIGDGLIKAAAAFFATAGVQKMRISIDSDEVKAAALAAGFLQTKTGFELDPTNVKRNCGGH
ncbi:MAG TPA: hypothetical protein PK629_03520 [Oscillospiraceae bacterium]|nr:hypothetical protein [Oscillospiraceae bacterium]HPF57146.1 hypothetical protein [Clostridiales bacterium]HPK35652.1 hypothetical protein [Oscillospiraceae bacterium]HPR75810.1 hypothetical protein [Oscillospiraceae bacterium]